VTAASEAASGRPASDRQSSAARWSCQLTTGVTARPDSASHSTNVSVWSAMPIAATGRLETASRARDSAESVPESSSPASCSTMPAAGRSVATGDTALASWFRAVSKAMQRVLELPWSMARITPSPTGSRALSTRRSSHTGVAGGNRQRLPPIDAVSAMLPAVRRPLVVLLFLAIFAGELMWNAIVPLVPAFSQRFGLSKLEGGELLASTSVAILLVSIPAGMLSERYGERRLTLVAMAVMAAADLGQGLAGSFAALLGARALFGLGFGILWTAGVAWLSEASGDRHAQALSLAMTTAGFGAIAGPAFAVVLV